MAITLRTPVMGVVGWFTTEQGTVIGPVDPAEMELGSTDDGRLSMALRFHLDYPEGPSVLVTGGTVHIGEVVRRHDFPAKWLVAGDWIELNYSMTGVFED